MKNLEDREVLLEVKNLKTYFTDKNKEIFKVLDGINFKVFNGKTLGILGPSGVGKSVLARAILRLIDYPGKIIDGEVLFKGRDLLKVSEEELNDIRGREISLVLQNAPGGIDPVRDMTFTTSQPYREHTDDSLEKFEIKMLVINQLGLVKIPEPVTTSDKFAHQLSGGESQRVKIASALINTPTLLIADEPIANLDEMVARQILDLLHEMKKRFHLTMIFIAHNLGVLAEISDYIAVIYAGQIIEFGDVETIFYSPKHPYTQGLFYASPSIAPIGKLKPIPNNEPDSRNYPSGCRFHPRCSYAIERCKDTLPDAFDLGGNHIVACWRWKEIPEFQFE